MRPTSRPPPASLERRHHDSTTPHSLEETISELRSLHGEYLEVLNSIAEPARAALHNVMTKRRNDRSVLDAITAKTRAARTSKKRAIIATADDAKAAEYEPAALRHPVANLLEPSLISTAELAARGGDGGLDASHTSIVRQIERGIGFNPTWSRREQRLLTSWAVRDLAPTSPLLVESVNQIKQRETLAAQRAAAEAAIAAAAAAAAGSKRKPAAAAAAATAAKAKAATPAAAKPAASSSGAKPAASGGAGASAAPAADKKKK